MRNSTQYLRDRVAPGASHWRQSQALMAAWGRDTKSVFKMQNIVILFCRTFVAESWKPLLKASVRTATGVLTPTPQHTHTPQPVTCPGTSPVPFPLGRAGAKPQIPCGPFPLKPLGVGCCQDPRGDFPVTLWAEQHPTLKKQRNPLITG